MKGEDNQWDGEGKQKKMCYISSEVGCWVLYRKKIGAAPAVRAQIIDPHLIT